MLYKSCEIIKMLGPGEKHTVCIQKLSLQMSRRHEHGCRNKGRAEKNDVFF